MWDQTVITAGSAPHVRWTDPGEPCAPPLAAIRIKVKTVERDVPDRLHEAIRGMPLMSNSQRQRLIEHYHTCARCRAHCCPNPECAGACQGLGDCLACREFHKYALGIEHQGYVPRQITGQLFHVLLMG